MDITSPRYTQLAFVDIPKLDVPHKLGRWPAPEMPEA